MRIRSAFGPGVDFQHFGSTFALAERSAARPHVANTTLDGFIQTALADAFAARGYRRVSEGTPDFLVDYWVVRQMVGGLRESTLSPVREEGALVVDVLDGATQTHVWRGYATAQIDETAPPAQVRRLLLEALRRVLEHFPPEGTQ